MCQCCYSYPPKTRGLCSRCYSNFYNRGDFQTLDDLYPRSTHNGHTVLQELRHLGFDSRFPHRPQFRRLAPRLQMTAEALSNAFYRAERRARA